MSKIEVDRYGHCVKCHKKMIVEQIVDRETRKRFTQDYSTTEFLLDDGTRMKVAICKDCKESLTEEQYPAIMKCVIDGWRAEMAQLDRWTEEKKKDYMDRYSKREIVVKSEDIPADILAKHFKKYKDKKEKEK